MNWKNIVISAVIGLLISSLGTVFYYSFNTIEGNKKVRTDVAHSVNNLAEQFANFTESYHEQMETLNGRFDNLSDSLTCYRSEAGKAGKDRAKLDRKIRKVIYELGEQSDIFKEMYERQYINYNR